MPLTISSRSKRQKTSPSAPSCISIDHLPSDVLQLVASFLTRSQTALLAAGISSPTSKINCQEWDGDGWNTMDFSDLDKDLAARLTDGDLNEIFRCIDAVKSLKTVKLTGLVGVIGIGLRSLRKSAVLRQIDLSLVGQHEDPRLESEPMLSKAIVIPILSNIVSTFGNSLHHIQLPKLWRLHQASTLRKSQMLDNFLFKYNKSLDYRFNGCSGCDRAIWGHDEGKCWVERNGKDAGLQLSTCYVCTNRFCGQCNDENTPYFCNVCDKKYCQGCVTTKRCHYCETKACNTCMPMEHCIGCQSDYCGECLPVETCTFCNRTRCVDCVPHYR